MAENEVMMEETTPIATEDTTWDGSDLFTEDTADDTTEDTTTEGDEGGEAEHTGETGDPAAAQEDTTPVRETATLRYLGKDYPVSQAALKEVASGLGLGKLDDVVSVIQKGMNYDRAIENTPLHKIVAKYADANGMEVRDYVAFLNDHADENARQAERERVRAQHPEWDDEKITLQAELNRTTKKNAKIETEIKRAVDTHADRQATEEERLKPFLDFIQVFPDVKEFPPEVAKAIKDDGIPPIAAYKVWLEKEVLRQENETLKTKVQQAEKKKLNKEKSTGSVLEDAGEVPDDFLKGLFSG